MLYKGNGKCVGCNLRGEWILEAVNWACRGRKKKHQVPFEGTTGLKSQQVNGTSSPSHISSLFWVSFRISQEEVERRVQPGHAMGTIIRECCLQFIICLQILNPGSLLETEFQYSPRFNGPTFYCIIYSPDII